MRVSLQKIDVKKNVVNYCFEVQESKNGEADIFLSNTMEIKYSFDLSMIPHSVLVVPFVCSVLPIIWVCDGTLVIDELDEDFASHIFEIKNGYCAMYPTIAFKASIEIGKALKMLPKQKIMESASFFSGGVDAWTTMLRHIGEKPVLVTLWGADIDLENLEGWRTVDTFARETAREYELTYLPIKSSFRKFINEGKLSKLIKKSGDDWWHGFMHGVGIIGHAAPIAYYYGINQVYIASSFTQAAKNRPDFHCASDPTIDNNVHYCGCRTVHDGFELSRQDKVRFLVGQSRLGKHISLRVCWRSKTGNNCEHCEKCYRTILEILSEAGDPNQLGFHWDDSMMKQLKRDMFTKIVLDGWAISYYEDIANGFKRNKDRIEKVEKYKWVFDLDLKRFVHSPYKQAYKIMRKARGVLKSRLMRKKA